MASLHDILHPDIISAISLIRCGGHTYICWVWWCHDMITLSTLLNLFDGYPSATGGFPSQTVSNGELCSFHAVDLNNVISLTWRHCYESIMSYPNDNVECNKIWPPPSNRSCGKKWSVWGYWYVNVIYQTLHAVNSKSLFSYDIPTLRKSSL